MQRWTFNEQSMLAVKARQRANHAVADIEEWLVVLAFGDTTSSYR